jgi:hypothetical protein
MAIHPTRALLISYCTWLRSAEALADAYICLIDSISTSVDNPWEKMCASRGPTRGKNFRSSDLHFWA